MSPEAEGALKSEERVLVITRVYDAPRELVWKAWSEPERMAQWMGPRGFTSTVLKMDARPGGSYRFHMRAPDGGDHWAQGVYREVSPGRRLVYTWAWADAQGQPTRPETVLTVTFADEGGKTRLTLRQELFESESARNQHREGWSSSFDRLAEYLAAA